MLTLNTVALRTPNPLSFREVPSTCAWSENWMPWHSFAYAETLNATITVANISLSVTASLPLLGQLVRACEPQIRGIHIRGPHCPAVRVHHMGMGFQSANISR